MCYVDLDANPKAMFFMVNGQYLGVAFRFTNELAGKAVYPHVACKNMKFKVNFGQHPPSHPLTSNFRMMQSLTAEELVSPKPGPRKAEEAEMIMMVGLPACGKSVWCENYAKEQKEKKYYILGTNLIIDRMKVTGLIRKRNYHGRWEELIKRASAVLNKLFDVAKKRPRNYILDQTNVYFTARRRKMESFRGYKRIAAVIVNTPDVLDLRTEKQRKDEGKLVPEEAVMEMKKNFSLPEVGPSFDDIWYIEEKLPSARSLVESYRAEGIAFKNKRPFSGQGGQTIPANEPLNKKAKIDDRSVQNRGTFNNPSRVFQPQHEQHPPKLMETNARDTNVPPKTDNRNQPSRDNAPKRDERQDSRKESERERSGSKDRRQDRTNERGKESVHRDDKRVPVRDDKRDSRGERRDPISRPDRREPQRDNREPPSRDTRGMIRDTPREPPHDTREPPRDNRVQLRDTREMPRDNREPPAQDMRVPQTRGMQEPQLRDPARENRELLYGDRREPPRENRREPVRGEFPPRDERRELRERGAPPDGRPPMASTDGLAMELSRIPPEDTRNPVARDGRGLPRDNFRGHDGKDIPGRESRMPYPDPIDQGNRENLRRFPGNDWRNQSFQDEYRSQYTDDKVETFRKDLPFGRDFDRLREEGYYDDPRERDTSVAKFPFQTQPKLEEDTLSAAGMPPRAAAAATGIPPRAAATGGMPQGRSGGTYGDSMGGYGPPGDRYGRPQDEKPSQQGFGMSSYRNDKIPLDSTRRDQERPGQSSLLDEPVKSEPMDSFPANRNRYDGRPDPGRDASAVGEFGYGRQPAGPEGEFGGYRDYSYGYGEQDKTYGRPDTNRFDQSRVDPIKNEPGRVEFGKPDQGRFEQGRFDQNRPDQQQSWSDQQQGWSDKGRSDIGPQEASSKSLMDVQVSDYAQRAEHDQKMFDKHGTSEQKPRFEQGAFGAGDNSYTNQYPNQDKTDYNQKPETRYEQGYKQERYDNFGKPVVDTLSQDRSLASDHGNPGESWKTPAKPELTGRYDNPNYQGQGTGDRWGSQEQSSYYQGAGDRQNTYRDGAKEPSRYPSQTPGQSSMQDSYGDQTGRDTVSDQGRGSASQYSTNRNSYGNDSTQVSVHEQQSYGAAGVSTSAPINKSFGYSYTTNSTQNYSNTNDRMSYSYQTQMTTSTANYGQIQASGGGSSAYPNQRYGSDNSGRPADSALPPNQQSYGRSSTDPPSSASAPPPQDNYGGGANQSYEQQQQDYQKAYKQWYANYAQAYAQLAQQQPK